MKSVGSDHVLQPEDLGRQNEHCAIADSECRSDCNGNTSLDEVNRNGTLTVGTPGVLKLARFPTVN
jgi:hypothetical protein